MKKILFLLLGLAVSVSAVAGPQKHQRLGMAKMSKTTSMRMNKQATAATEFTIGNPVLNKLVSDKGQVVFQTERSIVKDATIKAVVTDQPAGTDRVYTRTGGDAIYRGSNGITAGNQSGTVQAVENGDTIWFKNLLYDPNGYMGNYWVYGIKNGNTVSVPLGQHVAYSSQYSAYIALGFGYVYVADGYIECNWDDTKTEVVYNIEDNVLKLQGTSHDTEADYPAYSGYAFCLRWTDDDSFSAPGEWNTELTYQPDAVIPETPTMYTDDDILAMTGGTMSGYYRSGNSIIPGDTTLYLAEQDGIAYVYYDADGSTVYMRDPVYSAPVTGKWVKGTISGNKITVPLGQYLYFSTNNYIGLQTAWGQFVPGTGFSTIAADEVTYTINGNIITMDGGSEYVGLALMIDSARVDPGWYGNLDYNTTYTLVPDEPTDVTADPVKSTSAQINWTEPGDATSWIVRYRVHPELVNFFTDLNDPDLWPDMYIRDADGDGNNWGYSYIDDAQTDIVLFSYSAAFDASGSYTGGLTPDNWLLIPFDKMEGTFSLAAWSMNASYPDNFGIYAAAGENATYDDYVQVGEDQVASTTKTTYTYDIKGAGFSGPGWIAIRHYNSDDMLGLIVDDLAMTYEGAGEIGEWVVDTVTTNPYTIQPLLPETRYEVEVAGIHEGGILSWLSEAVYFTTPLTDPGLRGDVNEDTKVNVSDVITLLNALNSNDWSLVNDTNANVNYDNDVNVSDVIQIINYLLNNKWYDE